MVDMRPTASQLLMEERLGEPLKDYVLKLRADERPWRWIARHVADKTGVTVSAESMRSWFSHAERVA